MINNVKDLNLVISEVEKKMNEGVIDQYIVVEQWAKKALDFLGINPHSLGREYYYSITEWVGIYCCNTPYLLHFSSDSIMSRNTSSWIDEAMEIMEKNQDIWVANPIWNGKIKQVIKESFGKKGNFYTSFGFSDQFYLIKCGLFKNKMYNEKHPTSERYPKYGGELFEKRVDSYMRNHNIKRITSNTASYISKNFTRNTLIKSNPLLRRLYIENRKRS